MVKYGAIWCNIVKLSTVQPCTSTVHGYLRTRGPVQSSVLHQEHSEAEGKDRELQQLPEADLFGICPAQIQCCKHAKLSVNKHE